MNPLKQSQIKTLKKLNCEDLAEKIDEIIITLNSGRIEKPVVQQKIPAQTLEWGETSPTEMTWYEAKKWCEEQGGRMPTRIELLQAYEDNVEGFVANNYWSATEYNSTYAYDVNFDDGNTNCDNKTNAYYVRCVRRINN